MTSERITRQLQADPLPTCLFRVRLEKLRILAGRGDAESAAHAIRQLRDLTCTLPLEDMNLAPDVEEIRALSGSDAPSSALDEERATGDPVPPFGEPELSDLMDLIQSIAA